ncbi:uncharacterized protein LOC142312588 [Anomaloglossus baeobatrachus]|uniref:uncharacterized protein LOC142312588 n=1 Tax=Anomaloglossus baeobatrachus TaxID=238106 RepID=UPI003F4FB827
MANKPLLISSKERISSQGANFHYEFLTLLCEGVRTTGKGEFADLKCVSVYQAKTNMVQILEQRKPNKRRVWTPSWKGAIITVLLGINIILIRIIEALVYQPIQKYTNELYKEVCLNKTNSSVYQQKDIEKYKKELSKELCPNKRDSSADCLLCPFDWRLHGNQCYYYSDEPNKTWSQSRDDCKMMGADLLVIKDQKQQEFIERTLKQKLTDVYWIGLHRDGDVWRWVDGEHFSSSLFQIKTQESGGCVSMTKSGYYKTSCSSITRWTCLKKAVRI